jgi:hypothetical protein
MTAPWQIRDEDVSAAVALLSGDDAENKRGVKKKVITAVTHIKDYKPTKPHVVRATLIKLEQALYKVRVADNALSEAGQYLLTSDLRDELECVELKTKKKANTMRPRRSGGLKTAAQKNKLAARLAFDLLRDHGIVPTLTDGGPYFTLTALLFKMATGQDREPERACTAVCKELHWRGGEALRERRRNKRMLEEQPSRMSDDKLAAWRRAVAALERLLAIEQLRRGS